jgi:hypothetical protein
MMVAVHFIASVVRMANSRDHCKGELFSDKIKEQSKKLDGFGEFSQQSILPISALAGLTENLALATYAKIGIQKKNGIFASHTPGIFSIRMR